MPTKKKVVKSKKENVRKSPSKKVEPKKNVVAKNILFTEIPIFYGILAVLLALLIGIIMIMNLN